MEYGTPPQDGKPRQGRKFIGVKFECCGVYSRIYFDEKRNGYYGCCPMCHRPVNVRVDPETGVDGRFFTLRPR